MPGRSPCCSSWSEARGELFEVFPFRHDLRYEASLQGGRLEIAVTVHACGQDTVPVAFGFHPYLSLPGTPRERWRVELPAMRTLVLDDHQIPTAPGKELPSQAFELAEREFDDGFDAVPAHAHFAVEAGDRRLDSSCSTATPVRRSTLRAPASSSASSR